MPLPTIANVCRVAFNWETSTDARRATNVLHFQRGAPDASLANLRDTLVASWDHRQLAVTTSNGFISEVVETPLYDLSASLVWSPKDTAAPADWVGQASGDWMPQVAALIKETTGLRGKSNRGRIYLPWVAESKADSSGLGAAGQTDLTDGWVAFANAMESNGWALVIASYKNRNAHQVLDLAAEKATATQRRRNRQ